jgi:poly(hydroxyalkanoate) depolymerase family esterase
MTFRNDSLRQAMRLMQTGDLHAATRAIQQGLGHADAASSASEAAAGNNPQRRDIIDAEFRVVEGGAPSPASDPPHARDGTDADSTTGHGKDAASPPWARARPSGAPFRRAAAAVAPAMRRAPHGAPLEPGFTRHCHTSPAGALDYLLYIPPGLDTAGAPLLLMLHGCTQTPDDFARGTRMNRLAAAHGYVVAYPAQSAERNQNRCWNWFRDGDQARDQGEPALLAALTRDVVATHKLDATRVHCAGLSAGGAMAAVLASTYPDLYAAIGVHSGLPIGLARDVPSAFAAMRKGGRRSRKTPAVAPLPAIVFHGDGDTTVHPRNGHGVIEQSLGDGVAAARADGSTERGTSAGGRSYTRTVHRRSDGRVAAEHWVVHGAAHAWSGGDAAGTYTDPSGPDASAQMLRFFGDVARDRAG